MKHVHTIVAVVALASSTAFAQESTLRMEEAKLGTEVRNKAIVGEDTSFAVGSRVFLWMRISGGASDSIAVEWKHGDQVFRSALYVGGSPWRTWAYKTVAAGGDWSVTVADGSGVVLRKLSFFVQ